MVSVSCQNGATPNYSHPKVEIVKLQVVIHNANTSESYMREMVNRTYLLIGINPQARNVEMKIVGSTLEVIIE